MISIISNLLPNGQNYPELNPKCTAGQTVSELSDELMALAQSTEEHLEVIPFHHEAFVFIGRPPHEFGLAWIHDHRISRLNELAEEHGLSSEEVAEVMEDLCTAYLHHKKDGRFCTDLHNRTLVVLPSYSMPLDVHDVIERVIHH
jgi:hypothetical protein